MIPENKQVAVKKALQNAFDINEFDDIQKLMKGLSSALIFKIIVRGNPYLLRVITRNCCKWGRTLKQSTANTINNNPDPTNKAGQET